jgi:hypothetical protein
MPHIENHPEVADSQIADSCNSCRQLQQSNPAERQSEPTEQQIIPLGIQMTQQAHTKLVSAIACAVQTSANVAAAGAAVCSPEGDPAETAGAPSAGSDQAAGHGLSSAADWLALAAMKHVLKPRISFSCTDQHGGQLQVDSKLFNAVVHNPGNTEIVAAAYDKDVLLPAHSSFCMSDLKGIKPFVEGEHCRASKDAAVCMHGTVAMCEQCTMILFCCSTINGCSMHLLLWFAMCLINFGLAVSCQCCGGLVIV